MAKKNIIWLSVIFVIIIAALIWLTQSLQWRSYIDAVEREDVPLVESQNRTTAEIKELEITALIPPSETFDRIVNDLDLTEPIKIKVNYVDQIDMTYESYKQFLLTEESGDIHLLPNEWILPLAVQGFFIPLDRLLTSEYVEEQTVALLESMKWNSNLWAAPYQIDPYIVIPHQSLTTYFTEAKLFNQAITDAQPDVTIEAVEIDELTDEDKDANDLTVMPQTNALSQTKLTTQDVINKILNEADPSALLVNSEASSVHRLFHFLNYVEQNGVNSGNVITESQHAILNRFLEQQQAVTELSIDEILQNEENLPLFLVVNWSELNKYEEQITSFYDVSLAELPIYWTNGYSFVIRHQTKQQQVAGQWIEALNRKMREQHITNVGMPIHKSNLKRLNTKWQQQASSHYIEAYKASSLMNVSPSWPTLYEQLNDYWHQNEPLSKKLNFWLEQSSSYTE